MTNVFEQTKGKEMDLMCNQVVSKVLEKLLPLAEPATARHFAGIVQKEMRIVCTDPYASHVLETVTLPEPRISFPLIRLLTQMMKQCAEVVSGRVEAAEDHVKFCHDWLGAACQYAFNNVEDFVSDIYASHVLRTAVHLLSGVELDVHLMKSNRSRKHLDKDGPECATKFESPEFAGMLEDFARRFAAWPQLHGNLTFLKRCPTANRFLQISCTPRTLQR